MKKIRVNIPRHPYDILIGYEIFSDIGAYLKELFPNKSVFIITNATVAILYLKLLIKSLKRNSFNNVCIYQMPDGERHKNIVQWNKVIHSLTNFDNSQNKEVFIINLGGGVVGDLGGFAASTYHRGIDYVQIPTTLLACVDSGIGGKVGINYANFKNCLGNFWHPKLVFIDIALLHTLNERQFKSGLAEVIKYGIAFDDCLFDYIEKKLICNKIFKKNVLIHICESCYRLKTKIVEQDPDDTENIRILLNYGHTIGHAIESASHYSYTHGESVSIGIVCANDLARTLGMLSNDVCERIETTLKNAELPINIMNCNLDEILKAMHNDKKFIHGTNRFVLLNNKNDICAAQIVEDIPNNIIRRVLKKRIIS